MTAIGLGIHFDGLPVLPGLLIRYKHNKILCCRCQVYVFFECVSLFQVQVVSQPAKLIEWLNSENIIINPENQHRILAFRGLFTVMGKPFEWHDV